MKRIIMMALAAILSFALFPFGSSAQVNEELDDDLLSFPDPVHFVVSPAFKESPKLGVPIPFYVYTSSNGEAVSRLWVRMETDGGVSLSKSSISSDSNGNFVVNVTIKEYGEHVIHFKNEQTSGGGLLKSECIFHFSLKEEDHRWDYSIECEDKVTTPYYTFTVNGEIQPLEWTDGPSRHIITESFFDKDTVVSDTEDDKVEKSYWLDAGKMTMKSDSGRKSYDVEAGYIDTKDTSKGFMMIFDKKQADRAKKEQPKQTKATVKDMAKLINMFANPLYAGGDPEFDVEVSVVPPMMIKSKLTSGTVSLSYDSKILSKLNIPQLSPEMIEMVELDPTLMAEYAADLPDGLIIPNIDRMLDMSNVGNLIGVVLDMMTGSDDAEPEISTMSGKMTLKRVRN